MAKEKAQEKQWTYTVDGESYRVSSLPPEAQQALKLLIETDRKLQDLNRQRTIYSAAAVQLNTVVQNNLNEEALIEEGAEEEEASEEEASEEEASYELGGRAD
jgi:hypothetical protein